MTQEQQDYITAWLAGVPTPAECKAQDDAFLSRYSEDYERACDRFEAAYDSHIEEMACGDY